VESSGVQKRREKIDSTVLLGGGSKRCEAERIEPNGKRLVSWVRGGLVGGEQDELPAILTAFDLLRGKRTGEGKEPLNQRQRWPLRRLELRMGRMARGSGSHER
jgi:hypothetical protein